MANPNVDDKSDYGNPRASHDPMDDEKPAAVGETREMEVSFVSAALAAAVEEQKPSMVSKNMLKLWWIMGIGYLVSTMNGYGKSSLLNSSCCQLY